MLYIFSFKPAVYVVRTGPTKMGERKNEIPKQIYIAATPTFQNWTHDLEITTANHLNLNHITPILVTGLNHNLHKDTWQDTGT